MTGDAAVIDYEPGPFTQPRPVDPRNGLEQVEGNGTGENGVRKIYLPPAARGSFCKEPPLDPAKTFYKFKDNS